jgi:uncharacterized protein (TIGR02117 family)
MSPLRRLALLAALPPLAAGLYAAAALIAAVIPAGGAAPGVTGDATIWLCGNAVHTDIVLPAAGGPVDWSATLPASLMRAPFDPAQALAFGWGDRAFYLATPTWRDFRPATAVDALIGGDGTVLHVEMRVLPAGDPTCRRLALAPQRLALLDAYLVRAMARDAEGRPIPLVGSGYGPTDGFLVATGRYSVLLTCNEWVRRGLAAAGLRTALWSPFPFGLHRYPASP